MAKNEKTSPSVARKASAVLTNPNASPRAKCARPPLGDYSS